MQIREISYILAIAKYGSISAAAEKLYVSQPYLSQFLRSYEDSLGTSLFVRSVTGVELTPAGEKFVSIASKMEEMYDKLQQDIRQIQGNDSCTSIRFGIPASKGNLYLANILQRFGNRYPHIQILINGENSTYLEQALLMNELDMIMVAGPLDHEELTHKVLTQEEIYLAVSSSHKIFKETYMRSDGRLCVRPEAIKTEHFVFLAQGCRLRKEADRFFEKKIDKYVQAYEVGNIDMALGLVRSCLGYTFVSAAQASTDNGLEYLSVGDKGIFRDIIMAYRKKADIDPIYAELTEDVAAVLSVSNISRQK